ncbi:MAG: hypothetical protein PVH29_06150 [Candidatus Zixiibacteriota bacterium]|jgi:hypothetical protein
MTSGYYCPKFDHVFERLDHCVHYKNDRRGERCELTRNKGKCIAEPRYTTRDDGEG